MNSKNSVIVAVLISSLFFALSVTAGPKKRKNPGDTPFCTSCSALAGCYCCRDEQPRATPRLNEPQEEPELGNLSLVADTMVNLDLLETHALQVMPIVLTEIAACNDIPYLQEQAYNYTSQAALNNSYAIDPDSRLIAGLSNFYMREEARNRYIVQAIYTRIEQLIELSIR